MEGYWILKFSSSGDLVWEKSLGVEITRIIETSDGNLILGGETTVIHDNISTQDAWLGEFTSNGSVIWLNTYGGIYTEYFSDVIETRDNGYIIMGVTHSFGAGSYDGWILKVDSDGNMKWQKAYGGADTDWLSSIDETKTGDLLLAGSSNSYNSSGSIWIMKLTSMGDIIWQRNYGGDMQDGAHFIQVTPDGGIIVGGETNSYGAGGYDIWLLKLDSEGNLGKCDLSFNAIADVHSNSAFVLDTTITLQDITTELISRAYTIRDTSATSYWICPNSYINYLPYVGKN